MRARERVCVCGWVGVCMCGDQRVHTALNSRNREACRHTSNGASAFAIFSAFAGDMVKAVRWYGKSGVQTTPVTKESAYRPFLS